MIDPLLGELALFALVAVAWASWLRHRERTRRDIALSLLPLAIAILAMWLRVRAGVTPEWMARVGLLSLLLHPNLLLRVVDHHLPVPRWLRVAGWGGFAVAVVLTMPTPLSLPSGSALLAGAYFGALEVYAAVKLFGGAEPARGVLRRRLRLAGLGSIALGLAVALAAIDIAIWPQEQVMMGMTSLVMFIAATLFFFGFVTPQFLRTGWAMEEVRRLLLELSALTARDREKHAMQLLCRAGQSAVGGGAAAAIARDADDEPPVVYTATAARAPAEAPAAEAELGRLLEPGPGVLSIDRDAPSTLRALSSHDDKVLLRAPIASAERRWGVLLVAVRQPPLFPDDDLTVLGWLAEHVAIRLDADAAARARARLVSKLREANEELQRFVYVASHDLQEPLRMVSSFAQLLERRYRGRLDRDADEFIAYLVDGANRMQRLIHDLLMLSRAGTSELRREPVALEAVLHRALQNLAAAVRDAGAEITHDGLPEVVGDETQLLQLFQNLLSNALKFRRDDALQIHIAAEARGAFVRVRVQDNGEGIPPDQIEALFLPFKRLHGREIPGTGIGLAICKRVVERHGGAIEIESEVGRGTSVIFTLPARQDAAQRPPLPSAA